MKNQSSRCAEHAKEMGRALLDNVERLMSDWESRVAGELDSVEPAHRNEMRNHLPEYLHALGADYADENAEATSTRKLAKDHGRQRFQIGWDIDEIIQDYRVLQDVVIDHWLEKVPDLTARDVQSVTRAIDSAVELAVVSFRDFHDRENKAAREKARANFEKVSIGTAHADLDARITSANDNFASQLGYEVTEVVGKTIFELTHPDDLRLERSQLDGVLNGARLSYQLEKRLVDCRGHDVWVEWAIARHAVAGEDYLIVSAQDIARRRRLGEELQVAAREVHAARSAQRIFLRNIGHELRTPLNAIIGMNKLTLELPLPDGATENLAASQEAANVLLSLVNQVLAYAGSGRRTASCEPILLKQCLDDVCKALHERLQDSSVTAICEFDDVTPREVFGDEEVLKEILLHLVDNAIKFTEAGEVAIQVDVLSKATGEVRLRFSIRDTGIGIAEEDHENVFQPFRLVDASNTRRFAGVGLGLSISNALVEELGGVLKVTSKLGEGSIFWFDLTMPMVLPERFTRESPQRWESERTLRKPIRVLLAEDMAANRNLVLRALEDRRFDVSVAVDGREAIELAMSAMFDVVLMDLQMPKVDGLEAALRIRESCGPNVETPIIAVTAMAMTEDREKCQQVGMNDYLAKPIDVVELRAVVERWGGRSPTENVVLAKSESNEAKRTAIIDVESAMARLRGDRKMFCELAEFFVSDYPDLMEALESSIHEHDGSSARRAAHSLKGLVGTFSAESTIADIDSIHASIIADNFEASVLRLESLRRKLAKCNPRYSRNAVE